MLQGSLAPRSNKAGWKLVVEILDDDTSEAVDLSDADIVFEVRDMASDTILLSATIDNAKVSILDTGIFQVSFTALEMRTLDAKTYAAGCTISNDDSEPQQLIIGTLPVLDGVVS